MTQNIDIKFKERAESRPLNRRFRDITGPTVLSGFRFQVGSEDFSVDLIRGGHTSSVAIHPSGVRVEETEDVNDAVRIEPNDLNEGNPRVDSIYMVYQYGSADAEVSYTVVPGTGGSTVPSSNPNPNTHLLLGYVDVPPMGEVIDSRHFRPVETGIHTLEVANSATFKGTATFRNEVVFERPVRFLDGTIGAEDPHSSFVERLTYPIIAEPGQQEFKVPTRYTPKTNTLFVFKDFVPQTPDQYHEKDSTTFRFHDPLDGGEKIWFYWYRNISFYRPEAHNHDTLYYRKNEVNNRMMHHAEDYFAGMDGRRITHYLGTTNYTVIPPVPTDKTADIGEISVEKRENEIFVYNTGTFRGKFDITYYVKQAYQYTPNDEDIGFFDIVSKDLDTDTYTYRVVEYKRHDGTLYLSTHLENYDARGYYRRMRLDFYNSEGTKVIKTQRYALDYNSKGMLFSRLLIPPQPS